MSIQTAPKLNFLIGTYIKTLGQMKSSGTGGKPQALNASFDRALILVRLAHTRGGRSCFVGNGGSAAIASHMATDFFKNGGVRTAAFNDASMLTCLSNDYSYQEVFSKQVERLMRPEDIFFAVSSSGRSPNILKAVKAAKKLGCDVITLSGFDSNNPLRLMGEVNFYVPSHSYAHVENAHLLVCHSIVDALIASKSLG